MTQPSQDILQRIEALLRTGRQQESRLLLLEYLQSNPASTRAWWLLSQVVSDPDQQVECLERILQIDPFNVLARERIASLKDLANGSSISSPALSEESPDSTPPEAVFSSPSQEDEIEPLRSLFLYASTEEDSPALSSGPPKNRSRWPEMVLAAFLTIVLILGAFYLWNQHQSQVAAQDAEHVRETQAVALVFAQLPTSTAASSLTPTPAEIPTSLATFTPTRDGRFTVTPPPTDQVRPSAGYYAPSFNLQNIKTSQWTSLKQFAGRPVLLYFCDIASSACQEELDTMKALQQKYDGQDLAILAIISGENNAAVELYQKAEQLAYPVLVDLNHRAKKLYQVETIPAFYFIDATGKVVSIETGLLSYPQVMKQLGMILP